MVPLPRELAHLIQNTMNMNSLSQPEAFQRVKNIPMTRHPLSSTFLASSLRA